MRPLKLELVVDMVSEKAEITMETTRAASNSVKSMEGEIV